MGTFTQKQITAIYRKNAAAHKQRDAQDAAAPEITAIKITYDKPAADGAFEIVFMRRALAERYQTPLGTIEKLDFATGVTLALQADCRNGPAALEAARRFQQINPAVRQSHLAPI